MSLLPGLSGIRAQPSSLPPDPPTHHTHTDRPSKRPRPQAKTAASTGDVLLPLPPPGALSAPRAPRGAGAPPMGPMGPKGPRGGYGEAAPGRESPPASLACRPVWPAGQTGALGAPWRPKADLMAALGRESPRADPDPAAPPALGGSLPARQNPSPTPDFWSKKKSRSGQSGPTASTGGPAPSFLSKDTGSKTPHI